MTFDIDAFFVMMRKLLDGHRADLLDFIYDNVDELLLQGEFVTVSNICSTMLEHFDEFPTSAHLSMLVITKPWSAHFTTERALLRARLPSGVVTGL